MRNQDVLASDGQVHKEEERGEQASVHSNRNFIGPGHFSEMVRVMRVSEGVRGAHNYRKCPLPNLVFRLDIEKMFSRGLYHQGAPRLQSFPHL